MSYVTSYYHIIINTKYRKSILSPQFDEQLYPIIREIISKNGGNAIIINGTPNHIHMLVDLKTTTSLSDFMRNVKSQTSLWIKRSGLYPYFESWGKEYAAFSLSPGHRQAVYEYIKGQKEHHERVSLMEEIQRILSKNGLEFVCWHD